ncbi:hypothetical protein [Petropleomorpha daqingensis]|uniref:Uncharacterized protein n=1 Tax=Petropleomorpha daqingensis TaxID=2026353 RepID=A0A853CKY5_9ACTN|nr:hypothetical protein [Petropleomorpha daqingensis]NYJ07202.1 hypothetical protein [Petropleomorpha daqingensis]
MGGELVRSSAPVQARAAGDVAALGRLMSASLGGDLRVTTKQADGTVAAVPGAAAPRSVLDPTGQPGRLR